MGSPNRQETRRSDRRRRRATRGASLVEYLIVVGMIAIVVLFGARALQSENDKADRQAACVAALACGDGQASYALGEAALDPGDGGGTGTQQGGGGKSFWRRAGDFALGFFVDGAWGTVTGLWGIVTDPVGTAQGLWFVVSDPAAAVPALWDAFRGAWRDNPDRMAGNIVFEVVTLPIGFLKVTKAAKAKYASAAKTAKAASAAAKSRWARFGWREVNAFGGDGRLINCTRCVVAVDACLEGGAACALPMRDPTGAATNQWGNAVDIIDIDELARRMKLDPKNWKVVADRGALEAEALSWGDNAKGVVYVSWIDANGQPAAHVFNVVVTNGKVQFIDGQTGQVANGLLFSNPVSLQVIRSRDVPPTTVP